MIVEPDFIDHWKTRLLVRLLGTEMAPIHVIRLWSHCQSRKTDRFTGWLPEVLSSVCRWDGDAKIFWDAMAQTFCDIDGDTLIVHGWSDVNGSLISAWNNGKLGGRPKLNKPTENRPVIRTDTDRVSDREDGVDRLEKSNNGGTGRAKAPISRFQKPTREELDLKAAKIGLPSDQVDLFVSYYESNGWKVGRNRMVSWEHSLIGWSNRWRQESMRSGRRSLIGTSTSAEAPF